MYIQDMISITQVYKKQIGKSLDYCLLHIAVQF